jgi:urease accessory protein
MLALCQSAFGHPGHGPGGFSGGIMHPLTGLDHILAMVAVGLWAAQIGGRAIWIIPASFVGCMLAGGVAGLTGVPMPFVESGILASILVLGLLVATACRLPMRWGMALVGVFALCHGHAHGAEMPAGATPALYAIGFITATCMLHAVGIGLGLLARNISRTPLMRFAGVAIACCGLLMWLNIL